MALSDVIGKYVDSSNENPKAPESKLEVIQKEFEKMDTRWWTIYFENLSKKYGHCTKDDPLLKVMNLESQKDELKYKTYGEILKNPGLLEFKWKELKDKLKEINSEINKINKCIGDGQLRL